MNQSSRLLYKKYQSSYQVGRMKQEISKDIDRASTENSRTEFGLTC